MRRISRCSNLHCIGECCIYRQRAPTEAQRSIENRLAAYAGEPIGVHVRTVEEINAALEKNPFKSAAPNRTVAIFLDEAPTANALINVAGQSSEELALGRREIYVLYGNRMANSKLKFPAAASGTARNMNTIAKLAAMASTMLPASGGFRG
jgi:uncharacterized protein (DUF1697 family)